jgi:hypothetical protein
MSDDEVEALKAELAEGPRRRSLRDHFLLVSLLDALEEAKRSEREGWRYADEMEADRRIVPLADELRKIAEVALTDGDDYTPALNASAPTPRIPVDLARNHSAESAWRVGWMRGWLERNSTCPPPAE